MANAPGRRYRLHNGQQGGPPIPRGGVLIQPKPEPEPPITFDGRQFAKPTTILVMQFFDLAKRARAGDETAKEVLTAFGAGLVDVDGKKYWPMNDDEPKPDEKPPTEPETLP
jgi:hypothetical protein